MNKILIEGNQYTEKQIQISCYDKRLHFMKNILK